MSFIERVSGRSPAPSRIPIQTSASQTPRSQVAVRMASIIEILTNLFPGRDEQAEAVTVGLVSGFPVFLMSPPGTAKTSMVDTLAKLISGARYFYYLLNQYTEPDELLGPIDIKHYRETGEIKRRLDGRLADAEIVMLDEIFKASSAIRNVLLDIILNKRINDGGVQREIPLRALYTASNEVPSDEEDRAIYDRLLIRSFFDYAPVEVLDDILLKGVTLTAGMADLRPVASLEDVDAAQRIVREQAVSLVRDAGVRKELVKAVAALRARHVDFSDRRAVQTVFVAIALAVVRKKNKPSKMEIADAITYTAPQAPEQVTLVEEAIEEAGLIGGTRELEILKQLVAEGRSLAESLKKDQSIPTLRALGSVVKEIQRILKKLPRIPKNMQYEIDSILREYEKALEEIRGEIR